MNLSELKKITNQIRNTLQQDVSKTLDEILSKTYNNQEDDSKLLELLKHAVQQDGFAKIVDMISYTWFHYFCVFRFMDLHEYTTIKVVSSPQAQEQPEILILAKQGYFDTSVPKEIQEQILELLQDTHSKDNHDEEIYRLLFVLSCRNYYAQFPWMFQNIAVYAERLLPELLSKNSILTKICQVLTTDTCQHVEIIGWMYQFYISEKKNAIFTDIQARKKIPTQDIPIATQLFTPKWIVRYLVENSLGRLWMHNRPQSKLIDSMEYFYPSQNQDEIFIQIGSPIEIKICDPACGTGHILTYVFDILFHIYEEEGFCVSEIPSLILKNNIYGMEIDPQTGVLANFALMMKARSKHPRFFETPTNPNICIFENVIFENQTQSDCQNSPDQAFLSTKNVPQIEDFSQIDMIGSLLNISDQHLQSLRNIAEQIKSSTTKTNIDRYHFLQKILIQSEYIAQGYHVVVANPPYMGSKAMNAKLIQFAKQNYPNSKFDLFAMFIEKSFDLAHKNAYIAMITMQSWMFLSSYLQIRKHILQTKTILSLIHLGRGAFDSIGGEVVSTVAFVLQNHHHPNHRGVYIKLVDRKSENEKKQAYKEAIHDPNCAWLYHKKHRALENITNVPIAYWSSQTMQQLFQNVPSIGEISTPLKGCTTTNNEKYVRFWYEVSFSSIGFQQSDHQLFHSNVKRWCPYNKGGGYRKWYGLNYFVVDWQDNGKEIRSLPKSVVTNESYFFMEGLTWSTISSQRFGIRSFDKGFIFDNGGCCIFAEPQIRIQLQKFMNSKVFLYICSHLNPTLNFQSGDIAKIPFLQHASYDQLKDAVFHTQMDWNSQETSWEFTKHPLLSSKFRKNSIQKSYEALHKHWQKRIVEVQSIEEENNRIFIETFGLQHELTPDVHLSQITLTCNPHYRYTQSYTRTQSELDGILLCDTIKELISYAVGCMFGRYSIDTSGLILANQGETMEDFQSKNPNSLFSENITPIVSVHELHAQSSDIVQRFKTFLRLVFGEEFLEENLNFIEQILNTTYKNSIAMDRKKTYSIQEYFQKDFYRDHCKTYKKCPIYWLFSSPKGSFQVLIYMHRYQKNTLHTILHDHLRPYQKTILTKKQVLENQCKQTNISPKEMTILKKQIRDIQDMIIELQTYEKDILQPLAQQQITIDLNDGVRKNYQKFMPATVDIYTK